MICDGIETINKEHKQRIKRKLKFSCQATKIHTLEPRAIELPLQKVV